MARPVAVTLAICFSPSIRASTRFNGRKIFGHDAGGDFTRGVVTRFYDFVTDIARSARQSTDDLLARIESVEGEERYLAVRSQRRGAVLITAHIGAFEVGLAALRRAEKRVHVVFKRDAFGEFEKLRSRVRRMLEVVEVPIDDGFSSLVRLRDALRNDEVVVMQADRALAGQRSLKVAFLHGKIEIPLGPVKLAHLTGSPIVPVFVVRTPSGKFRISLGEPIEVFGDNVDAAAIAMGRAIEAVVARYPQQWLVLERAFVEESA